jgi:phosphoribosylformylglycinamidine cyclo-ligase
VDLALVGGETAEMPSVYKPGDYDIAGTIVGVVEKDRIIRGRDVKPGDVCLGLPSVSLHTNGYSLARKIVTDVARITYRSVVKEVGPKPIGEILLAPHKSYYQEIYPILGKVQVKAMAHITGGGLLENPPRVLPENCRILFERGSWDIPPLFKWLVRLGNVPEEDAYRSLNMGIGMVLIVGPKDVTKAVKALRQNGARPAVIGEVVRGPKGVEFV